MKPSYIVHEVGMLMSNSYVVYDPDTLDAVLIDAGDDAWKILDTIQGKRLRVSAIYATHCHFDHVMAVNDLRDALGCKFYIHRADEEILRNMKADTRRFLGIEVADPPSPDGYIDEGDSINIGRCSLRVIHTPGHSPGSVCYAGEGIVFTGDTLFRASIGRTDGPGGDTEKIVSSIVGKLFTLPDDTVALPGHGPPTTIGEERLSNPFVGERGMLRRS